MIDRFLTFIMLLALPAAAVCAAEAVDAASPQSVAAPTLVVLRNGEVLSGQVSREGDRTVVASEGTEIRLSAREVDFVCQTLDEAYTIQCNREVAGRIEDHLNLADWCLRHELLGYAAREITVAMQIDPKNPRVKVFDARLRRALLPMPTKATETDEAKVGARPVSADELERLVRSLPAGTVETFTATVQPMLLNYCATAGCHGPSSSSSFTLARAPLEKVAARRLTERNLYNTLQWIDHDNPIDSKLLSAAREPHGPNQASGATGVGTAKYQELVSWVLQASLNTFAGPGGKLGGSAPVAALPSGGVSVLASPSAATVLLPMNPPAPTAKRTSAATGKTNGAAGAGTKTVSPGQKSASINPAASPPIPQGKHEDVPQAGGDSN
jgi:hypothetical protein